MILAYRNSPIYVGRFHYELGATRWDLETLKARDLITGEVEALQQAGYRYCLGLAEDETLLSLARASLSRTLNDHQPRALVAQHCLAESAVLTADPSDTTATRNRYFPAAVMGDLQLEHVPYFCSFASGCAGFVSVLGLAGGVFSSSDEKPTVCFMADCRPPDMCFDMPRERILGSDHSSSFLVSAQPLSYQLLGINFYSTTRQRVPLLEIVKRTTSMIQDLASSLPIDLRHNNIVIHYPNIFPETWKMVTRYLRLPQVEPVMDGMSERAHCGATDSVISLMKLHRNETRRVHIVVNYGVGLHLGVCILREHAVLETSL